MKTEPAFKAKLKAGHALSEAFGRRADEAIDEGERELAEFCNVLQNRFGVVCRRPGASLRLKPSLDVAYHIILCDSQQQLPTGLCHLSPMRSAMP